MLRMTVPEPSRTWAIAVVAPTYRKRLTDPARLTVRRRLCAQEKSGWEPIRFEHTECHGCLKFVEP